MHTNISSSYRWTRAFWFTLNFFFVCFCVLLTRVSLFIIMLVILCFCILFSCCLVVSKSTIDCLGRVVPEVMSLLWCVEWDVKLYTHSHLQSSASSVRTDLCTTEICIIFVVTRSVVVSTTVLTSDTCRRRRRFSHRQRDLLRGNSSPLWHSRR